MNTLLEKVRRLSAKTQELQRFGSGAGVYLDSEDAHLNIPKWARQLQELEEIAHLAAECSSAARKHMEIVQKLIITVKSRLKR